MAVLRHVPLDAATADHVLGRHDAVRDARLSERNALRARMRAVIVPGLERLADASAHPADLIALADVQARRLRAELESPDPRDERACTDAAEELAREDEREWVRGHLHDTALQILEFIAGDGFGTGLTAKQIARLAGGAARDLRRWIDAEVEPPRTQLVAELESVAGEARALSSNVELEVVCADNAPTGERATALAGAVREALTNARKHANASRIVVRVDSEDGRTAVTVTDDGVGFDPDRVRHSRGLGVRGSIVGRMQRVGGHASLQQAPGGGTRVTLVTPTEDSA
jgi:anti-sigma regulatory factor (Ser/Thr protein kinase)